MNTHKDKGEEMEKLRVKISKKLGKSLYKLIRGLYHMSEESCQTWVYANLIFLIK